MRSARVRRLGRTLVVATATLALAVVGATRAAEPVFPDVLPDGALAFPRDHGAHPEYRTEWWYVTGWLHAADGVPFGFQVTFFRSRLAVDDANPSRFAPRQLLFAHAAIADARTGHLLHDERIARAGFGIAEASTRDADVVLDRWRFVRTGASPDALAFHTSVDGRVAFDLDLVATGAPLAQGADPAHPGYSQKGPVARDASRYYSVPQIAVTGTVVRDGRRVAVTGTAWLDREWSSAYLDPQASGWDWVGLNLDDGGALMAFRMRDRAGGKLWAGGARRFPDGRVERYRPEDVDFSTLRQWTSPRSHAAWPVAQRLVIHGPTALTATLDPLMDDQELDSRASTGTIYWEGAVRMRGTDGTTPLGRGYLEMTGYVEPIRF